MAFIGYKVFELLINIFIGIVAKFKQKNQKLFRKIFIAHIFLMIIKFFYVFRCRSSRGDSLDSVGLTPPAMETTNGGSRSRSDRSRDQWSKYTEPHNGHQVC